MVDDLYLQVKEYCKSTEYVSIARLCRTFSIGFVRAATLFQQLIDEHIVEYQKDANESIGAKSLIYDAPASPKRKEPRYGDDVATNFRKFYDPYLNSLLVVQVHDYVTIKGLCDLTFINPNSAEAMILLLIRDGYIEPTETPNRGYKVIKKPEF